jgi:hypothetical protein
MELILPHPLGIDDEARQGYWHPNWLEVKPFKDPTNQGFVSAVIKQVIDNARVSEPQRKVGCKSHLVAHRPRTLK